jgi:signal transduction histidine kinase
MIKEASQQALTLTNELLQLHNKSNKETTLEKTAFTALIKKAIHLNQYRAEEKGQQLSFEQTDEEIIVMGSQERLNRVVNNLLVNAIKFSPIEGTINVKLEKENNQALLTVIDNGIGIPEEQKINVFDRFTSVRRRGTLGEKSYGLGLSICKEIIEEYSGTIQVENNIGGGTIFNISLPLANDV